MNRVTATLLALLALLYAVPAGAGEDGADRGADRDLQTDQLSRAALIIDDIGDLRLSGMRAIGLPGKVTIAVLPHTPYARELAKIAHENGREVMLHMPMEAKNRIYPGPGAILLDMDEQQVRQAMRDAIADIPHARGVNNHMGSLITRHPGHMDWIMEELKRAGDLYFIDSRTSAHSVAQDLAAEHKLNNSARSVFLDPQQDREVIERQIKRFIAAAQKEDGVIAIGHPYPETFDLLEQYLPKLKDKGIKLVPPSTLVDRPAADPVKEAQP